MDCHLASSSRISSTARSSSGAVHELHNEDDTDSISSDTRPSREVARYRGARAQRRTPGACAHCKALKIRCEFIPEENTCARCKAAGQACIIHGRKKRRPAPTHEDLQKRSFSQDIQIQSLLRQLDEMKALAKVRRWLDPAQDEATSLKRQLPNGAIISRSLPDLWDYRRTPHAAGDARPLEKPLDTFVPVNSGWHMLRLTDFPSATNVPDILKSGLLSLCDVASLFDLYFEKLHPWFAILDPRIHTPQKLASTSDFLFTVVCALSSRHWTHRPKLHRLAMMYAENAAAEVLKNGSRTIEACQAYTLLAVYPTSYKRYIDARGWLLIGMAARIAQELRLDQPPPAECNDFEKLNRIRTWFQIVCVDASHAIQFGKPPMAHTHDYIARTHHNLFLLVLQFTKAVTPEKVEDFEKHLDVESVVFEYDTKLSELVKQWWSRFGEQSQNNSVCAHRNDSATVLINALRLVILGFGFHHAVKRGLAPASDLFKMSVQTARTVVRIHIECSYPAGVLRYAFEPEFLYVAFAAAFLLNLLQKQFHSLVDPRLRMDILKDIAMLAQIYSSPDVAVDSAHAPAVYARFLSSLLDSLDEEGEHLVPGSSDTQVHEPQYVQSGDSQSLAQSAVQRRWDSFKFHDDHAFLSNSDQHDFNSMSFNHFASTVSALDTFSNEDIDRQYAGMPADPWNYCPIPFDQPTMDTIQYTMATTR